jgi:hypothetical protein
MGKPFAPGSESTRRSHLFWSGMSAIFNGAIYKVIIQMSPLKSPNTKTI